MQQSVPTYLLVYIYVINNKTILVLLSLINTYTSILLTTIIHYIYTILVITHQFILTVFYNRRGIIFFSHPWLKTKNKVFFF